MRLARPSTSPIDAIFTPTPFDRAGAMDEPFVASLGSVFEAGTTTSSPMPPAGIRTPPRRRCTNGGICSDAVESIEVHTHRSAKDLSDRTPTSLDHAQYGFPFVLATVVLTGALGADEMSDESLDDPDRLALAHLVSVYHDPALNAEHPAHYGTRTVLRTRDGSVLEELRLVALDDPGDPMTDDELLARYQRLNGAGLILRSVAPARTCRRGASTGTRVVRRRCARVGMWPPREGGSRRARCSRRGSGRRVRPMRCNR